MDNKVNATPATGSLDELSAEDWNRLNKAVGVNVLDYGAVGDGVTDDTAALAAAAAKVIANGGGKLYFPKGIYQTTQPINLQRTGGVHLEVCGEGSASVIRCSASSQVEAVLITDCYNAAGYFHIHDLWLHGNSEKAYYGLLMKTRNGSYAEPLWVENVTATNCVVGIHMGGAMVSHIKACSVRGNRIGLFLKASTTDGGANANLIEGLDSYVNEVGICVYSSQSAYPLHNNRFIGGAIQGSTKCGVLVIGKVVDDHDFQGIHFENSIVNPITTTASVDVGTFGSANSLTVTKAEVSLYSGTISVTKSWGIYSTYTGAHTDLETFVGAGRQKGTIKFDAARIGPAGPDLVAVNLVGKFTDDRTNLRADVVSGQYEWLYGHTITQKSPPPAPHRYSRNRIIREIANTWAPATSSVQYDSELGRFFRVTFGASTGSFFTNSMTFWNANVFGHVPGSVVICTFMARSSVGGARFNLQPDVAGGYDGGGGGFTNAAFTLGQADVWYHVTIGGSQRGLDAGSSYSLAFYPLDTSGATLDVRKLSLMETGDTTDYTVPAWDAGTTYQFGDMVYRITTNGSGNWRGNWYSLANNNVGHDPCAAGSIPTYWWPGTNWYAVAAAANANLAPSNLRTYFDWDPASVASGASVASSDVTVAGARLGDAVRVVAPYDLQGLTATGYVRASSAIRVVLANLTGSPVDLGNGKWHVIVTPQDED